MFKALLLEKDDAGFRAAVKSVDDAALPEGDCHVRIEHSTLNYKDALAITNKSPIVRSWPMVAGIDGAGTVLAIEPSGAGRRATRRPQRLGRRRDALGLPGRARALKGDWLVALPPSLSTRQAMAIGTAGYTAMLRVLALERHGVSRRRAGARHRRERRRRQRRDRAARAARPSGRRRDRHGSEAATCASSAPPTSSTAPS
jgi:acrylyl-CoA reductase (NADPH)